MEQIPSSNPEIEYQRMKNKFVPGSKWRLKEDFVDINGTEHKAGSEFTPIVDIDRQALDLITIKGGTTVFALRVAGFNVPIPADLLTEVQDD